MKIDELRQFIENILNQYFNINLYFIFKNKDQFTLRQTPLEQKNTLPELTKLFTDFLYSNIVEQKELEIRSLMEFNNADGVIYQYDYDTYPAALELFCQFSQKKDNYTDCFNFERDNLSQLYGYIISLGTQYKNIIMFKKHYPVSLIRREQFLLGALKSKESFEKLSGEDIIKLNGEVQLLKIDDTVLVLDYKMLEQYMGLLELMKRDAVGCIENIKKLDIVEDIETLDDTLSDPSFIRKLSRIRNSPVFKLDRDTILKFTKNTAKLKGKFKYSEDGCHIILDTIRAKNNFLKLMNDSYLHSELTGHDYEAEIKDPIGR